MSGSADLFRSVCGVAEQLNPRLRTASDKNPNDVYVGLVRLPGCGWSSRARAYVKIFPPATRGQLVFNEVLAHFVALQCALPTPLTFACACRRSLLRAATLSTMAPKPTTSEYVLGVASIDGADSQVKQRIVSSDATRLDVLNWPSVAKVAVFDELMGNDDRHLANLIRRGPRDYMLIDNERILFGEQWFNSDLRGFDTRRCDANILADTIAETTDEVMRRRMLSEAQHLVLATSLTVPSECEELEAICGAPAGATRRAIEMFNRRRTHLCSLMQYHLQKGDLFQARTNR